MREADIQYKVFEWLRFPLIVGVVFIHSFGKSFDYDALDLFHLSGMDCYNLLRVGISQVLTHICVPTFYFISGYLFFNGLEFWNNTIWIEKVKRRVKTLFVPFLIWNTISIIFSLQGLLRHEGWIGVHSFFIDNGYWHLYWDCNEWNLDRTDWLGGVNSASSPYLIPLWFLRDLMVVVLCSPFIFYFLKKLKVWMILLLFVSYVSGVFVKIPGFSTMAFFFFSLGAYMKTYNISPTELTYRYRYSIAVIAVFLCLFCTLKNGHNTKMGDLIYPFYVITGFFTLLNLVTIIVSKELIELPTILSKSSFFIYLSHTIILLPFFKKVVSKIFGEVNPVGMTVSYLLAPTLTILTCILLYYLLKRLSPSICNILTGDR